MFINKINYKEINLLDEELTKYKIPHEFYPHEIGYGFHLYYPNRTNCKCSVILAPFSNGSQYGLLEIMGLLTDEEAECDDVVGYLTMKDVFDRIVKDYNKS